MITLSKVPAFGFETSLITINGFSDHASKVRHNAQKIIGYVPGLSVVQGFEHLAQACQKRKFSPLFILRGLLEIACLSFLLIIPDLIVTLVRQKQQLKASATLQGRTIKPLKLPTTTPAQSATESKPTQAPAPAWTPIREQCKLALQHNKLTEEWLEKCLKQHKIDDHQPGVKEELQKLGLEVAEKHKTIAFTSYLLNHKLISRNHPQDIEYLRKVGLAITKHSSGSSFLQYLELNPDKPGCLKAIQDIACASAKKYGYVQPPGRLNGNIDAHREVLYAILKEASQSDPLTTLKMGPIQYKLERVDVLIEAWTTVTGSLQERRAKALRLAEQKNTPIAKCLSFFNFDANKADEKAVLIEIARLALKNNFLPTLMQLPNFGLQDYTTQCELLVGAALQAAENIEYVLSHSPISVDHPIGFASLQAIAIEAAKQKSADFSEIYLKKFPFNLSNHQHRDALLEIGKAAAFSNPTTTLLALDKYTSPGKPHSQTLKTYIAGLYKGTLEERKALAQASLQRNVKEFSLNASYYFSLDVPEDKAALLEMAGPVYQKGGLAALRDLGLHKLPEGKETIKQIIVKTFSGPDVPCSNYFVYSLKEYFGIEPTDAQHKDFFRTLQLKLASENPVQFWHNVAQVSIDLHDQDLLAAVLSSALTVLPIARHYVEDQLPKLTFDQNDPKQVAAWQAIQKVLDDDKQLQKQPPLLSFSELLARLKATAQKKLLYSDKCNALFQQCPKTILVDPKNVQELKLLFISLAHEKHEIQHVLNSFFLHLFTAEERAEIGIAVAQNPHELCHPTTVLNRLNFHLDDPLEQKLFCDVLNAYAPLCGYKTPEVLQEMNAPEEVAKKCLLAAVKEFPKKILQSPYVTKLSYLAELEAAAMKTGSLQERRQQALLEAKQKPDDIAQNIYYYGFSSSIPEERAILDKIVVEALKHDIANLHKLYYFDLEINNQQDRKIVQAGLLECYNGIFSQHFTEIKHIINAKWIDLQKPDEFACFAQLLKKLAANDIFLLSLHFSDYKLQLDNPLIKQAMVKALEAAYQANPEKTIQTLPKLIGLDVSPNDLKSKYPKATGTLEERQKKALNALQVLNLVDLHYFFALPEELDLLDNFAVEALVKTKSPEVLFNLGYTPEQHSTKIKELLLKACAHPCADMLNFTYGFINKHEQLNDFDFRRAVLLTSIKPYPPIIAKFLSEWNLDPSKEEERLFLTELGIILAQYSGAKLKSCIGFFGLNKKDKKQREALVTILKAAYKEDGPKSIDPKIGGDLNTYKGAKFYKSWTN